SGRCHSTSLAASWPFLTRVTLPPRADAACLSNEHAMKEFLGTFEIISTIPPRDPEHDPHSRHACRAGQSNRHSAWVGRATKDGKYYKNQCARPGMDDSIERDGTSNRAEGSTGSDPGTWQRT